LPLIDKEPSLQKINRWWNGSRNDFAFLPSKSIAKRNCFHSKDERHVSKYPGLHWLLWGLPDRPVWLSSTRLMSCNDQIEKDYWLEVHSCYIISVLYSVTLTSNICKLLIEAKADDITSTPKFGLLHNSYLAVYNLKSTADLHTHTSFSKRSYSTLWVFTQSMVDVVEFNKLAVWPSQMRGHPL
jgi:hypothetical protein